MRELMKHVWYRTPVIGGVASLGRKTGVTKDGWFQSEISLCDNFYRQIHRDPTDPALYDKASRYLQKVQEYGRRPMGARQWLFIGALFLGEAVIFSVIFIPYLASHLSFENEQHESIPGIILSTVLALALVLLTYKMGKVLHYRSLVMKARRWWFHEADKESGPRITEARGQVGLATNERDDDQPRYIQLLNRIEHNADATPGGGFWIAFALGMILTLATIAGYACYQIQQVNLNIIVYLIMALFYFWIQYSCIRLGEAHSFVGRESKEAYQFKTYFSSSEDFQHWKKTRDEEIGYKADEMLTTLQAELTRTDLERGVDNELRGVAKKAPERNFNAYLLRKERLEQEEAREKGDNGEASRDFHLQNDHRQPSANLTPTTK